MKHARRGQSTGEWAILLGVVVAMLIGMQIYTKRGLNARLKDGSDSVTLYVTKQFDPSKTTLGKAEKQYEPYYASSNFDVAQNSKSTMKEVAGGIVSKLDINEATTRTGYQKTEAAPTK